MQIEIRKTSESVCPTCGSHDLISVHGVPLTANLSEHFEVELLRREAEFVKTFKARLDAERAQGDAEWRALSAAAEEVLASAGADVPGWRRFRRSREAVFRARLEEIIHSLLDQTRYPIVGSHDEPDRS